MHLKLNSVLSFLVSGSLVTSVIASPGADNNDNSEEVQSDDETDSDVEYFERKAKEVEPGDMKACCNDRPPMQ